VLVRRRRRILNQTAIVDAVAAAVALRPAAPFAAVAFRVVDFADVSVRQQLQLAATSDVLLGIHGTAMQLAVVMRPRAVLVEVQYEGYTCTGPGLNPPSRRHCEFGQTAIAAGVHHLVHRVAARDIAVCDTPRRIFCDVRLGAAAVERLVRTALCARGHSLSAAATKCPVE
jgi:hypothetical protein